MQTAELTLAPTEWYKRPSPSIQEGVAVFDAFNAQPTSLGDLLTDIQKVS